MVVAERADRDRIPDVDQAWRAFRAFLAVPLEGLFDRREGADDEADTLVVEFGASGWTDDLPGLLVTRRFDVRAAPSTRSSTR